VMQNESGRFVWVADTAKRPSGRSAPATGSATTGSCSTA
jgi:hypothetical protein